MKTKDSFYLTIDIETTGLDRFNDKITFIGIGYTASLEEKIPKITVYNMQEKEQEQQALQVLKKIERCKAARLIFQNGKFDTLFLEVAYNIKLKISDDTMLLGTVYDLTADHNLKDMAKNYLKVDDWDISTREKKSGKDIIVPYLKKDVEMTWRLYRFFKAKIKKPEQRKLYKKLLLPAYKMYRIVERNGIYIDLEELKQVRQDYQKERENCLERLKNFADINWNSSKQITTAFYTDNSLPILSVTNSGNPSADAATLHKLKARGYQVAADLLEFRQYDTALKMFLTRWDTDAAFDGRLHPSFNLTNVVSGRTSCNNPNLQQCYDKETEILTENGFKFFADLKENEKVAQWNLSGTIDFVLPTRYIRQKYTGNMVELKSSHIDLLVTPNHRCLLQDRKKFFYKVVLAEDYPADFRHLHAGAFLKGSIHLSEELITLICALQADGEIQITKKLRFVFAKDRKVNRLTAALDKLNIQYTFKRAKNGKWDILAEKEAFYLCKPYIDDCKQFTKNLIFLDCASRNFFLEETRFWDGLVTRDCNVYTSIKKVNADIVQILYTLNGTRALLSVYDFNHSKTGGKHSVAYRVYETKRNYSLTTNVNKNLVPYDGYVFCVEVPSSYIIVRRNGKTSISGNCPKDKRVRGLFKAPNKKRMFFEADYSQLELRLAAHYSKDKTMINIYKNDGDIHTETAKALTGGREPSKAERSMAKPVNFGFLYGMQAKKFVEYAFNSYGVSFTLEQAEEYRAAFFKKYKGLLPWHEKQAQLCAAQGGVYTLFGRFRKLPKIYSQDKYERGEAERCAINSPVQGTGSDILLCAALELQKYLAPEGLKICGTIHDSVVGEFWAEDEPWIVDEIKYLMEQPELLAEFGVELAVPLKVDVGVGPWGSK